MNPSLRWGDTKMMKTKKIPLLIVLVAVAGIIWYIEAGKVSPGAVTGGTPLSVQGNPPQAVASSTGTASGAPSRPAAAAESLRVIAAADARAGYKQGIEIADPTGFVNASSGFKLADIVGKKVILVDFWTYSCINCIRTLPYLTAWYKKYHDQGLAIVGIHTPEFEFEKDINNVKAAAQKYGIYYPVILDSNYGTWNAYGNRYWPHEYLIDIAGYVVHDQIGEGSYDETEAEIQKLLKQREDALGMNMAVETSTVAIPEADLSGVGSPETYFGANRNEFLGNGVPGRVGEQSFAEPVTIEPNKLYLVGSWNVNGEYAETSATVGSPQIGSDRIDYRYRAKGVYLVAGSPSGPIEAEVLLDSAPIDASIKGVDVYYKNGKSYVKIQGNRLYRIIDDKSSAEHFLEFIISNPGFQAYTFTFG